MLETRWLDAPEYASVIVIEEHARLTPVAIDLDRRRALQLLSRASRERRNRSSTAITGQLALLRVARVRL